MIGLKSKPKTEQYPEIFHFNPGNYTLIFRGTVKVLYKRLLMGNCTYKGRFVDKKHTVVELEEFKGETLPYIYFSPKDEWGHEIK